MKDELGREIIIEFARTYSFLIDDSSKDKKAKGTKKCVIKRKLKLEDYKNCLEVAQIENKINYLEKNEIDVDSLSKHQKEFRKINKLMLKTHQRFRSEKHYVFNQRN